MNASNSYSSVLNSELHGSAAASIKGRDFQRAGIARRGVGTGRKPLVRRRPELTLHGKQIMPETYAYFFLHGFECEPEEISAHLSLVPTRTWKKGEPYPRRKAHFFDYAGWQLESGLPRDTHDLTAPVTAVVDLLISRYESFATLPAHTKKGINCVGYYFSENPGFDLSPELAGKIAKLGLSVDFDLYNMRDSDELWFTRWQETPPNPAPNQAAPSDPGSS